MYVSVLYQKPCPSTVHVQVVSDLYLVITTVTMGQVYPQHSNNKITTVTTKVTGRVMYNWNKR